MEGFPEIPGQGILRDDVVVDPDGGLQWAFVFVRRGLEGKTFDPERSPASLEQVQLMYRPHVLGIRTGQPLAICNRDPWLHSVHASLPYSKAMPAKGEAEVICFSRPKIMESVGCDIHPWMKAWVAVMDHPFFAVTDASGKFEIAKLPQGRYTLGFWHERFHVEDQEIEVTAGREVQILVDMK